MNRHGTRSNPLDASQRKLVITKLVEKAGVTKVQAEKVADLIDRKMAEAGHDELPSAEYFKQLFGAVARKIVAGQKEKEKEKEAAQAKKEALEGKFEPAVEFDKPYSAGNLDLTTPEGAVAALKAFTGVLSQEGPVKGGGAAQRAQEGQEQGTQRRGRRKKRSNPYRLSRSRLNRGYRANPYLPSDQDPLSIYHARAARPGKAPLTTLEHLRAARLLRAHVKGTQDPPDFDKSEINAIIKTLMTRAEAEGWELPKSPRLTLDDHLIINPQSGSVRWIRRNSVLGLLTWKWAGKRLFSIAFPWYESEKDTFEDSDLVFAPPGNTSPTKKELLSVSAFVSALEGMGYRAEVEEKTRGQFITLGLRAEINAGKAVAQSLMTAGKILQNDSMQHFAQRLSTAWRSWVHIAGDQKARDGEPSGKTLSNVGLTPDMAELVATFYSDLHEEQSDVEHAALTVVQRVQNAASNRYSSMSTIGENILAAARVIEAIQGPTTNIIGLPIPSEKFPTRYVYEARPEDIVISLPSACVPFRIARSPGKSHEYLVFIGIKGKDTGGSRRPDSVDLRSAFWKYAKVKTWGPDAFQGLRDKTKDQPGIAPSSDKWDLKVIPTVGKTLISVGTSAYKISINQIKKLVRGFETGRSMRDPELRWFRTKFYEFMVNEYPPKVLTSDDTFAFLPIAVALRRGVLMQGLAKNRENIDEIGGVPLTLVLSEASPSASGAPVGAARLKDIVVKSLHTGKKITAPGLSPVIKKQIKTMLPPPSFRYAFVEKVAGKVGEGVKAHKRVFRPRPFQAIGIAFIHAANCRAMIGDEMGLGKTIQALGALTLDPSPTTGQSMLPALVICPPSVMGSWQKEIKRWLPHLSVGEAGNAAKKYDISIMSWGMVGGHYKAHVGRYMTVIVDEAHYGKRLYKTVKASNRPTLKQLMSGSFPGGAKGPFTLRTFGFVRIAQSCPHAILLSGTLMENGGKDAENMWTYLHALDPVRYPDRKRFTDRFFGKVTTGGPQRSSAAILAELEPFRQAVNEYHIRRMKSTVGEQVGLGCLYSVDYGPSDPGCAGGGEVTVIRVGDNDDTKSNPYRRRRISRKKAPTTALMRRVRRNSSTGYLKVGVTKKINQVYVEFDEEQKEIHKHMKEGLLGQVILAKMNWAVDQVIRNLTEGGKPDLRKLPQLVAVINGNLAEQDASKIVSVKLAVFSYLRNIIGQLKLPQAIEFIVESLQEKEPLIVWVDRRKVGDAIIDGLEGTGIRFGVIRGGTPNKERTKIINDFQMGRIDLIIASQAMREGVTLTRANRALFVELWWVGAWLSQAEDRIYRFGQKRDCTITYLLAENTIDDQMLTKIEAKRALQSLVFGSDQFKTESIEGEAVNVDSGSGLTQEELAARKAARDKVLAELAESTGEKGEEADLESSGAGLAVIEAVTESVIQKLLKEERERAAILGSGSTEMRITEEMVLEELKNRGIKEVSYALTKSGFDWSQNYVLKRPAEEALTILSKLTGIRGHITPSLRKALELVELIAGQTDDGHQNKKGWYIVSVDNLKNYEGGEEAVRALNRLLNVGNDAIKRRVLAFTGGVALNNAETQVLQAMQAIVSAPGEKIISRQVFQKAAQIMKEGGRKTKLTQKSANSRLSSLEKKGLVIKYEKALDITSNPRQERKIRSLAIKGIPVSLRNHMRKNAKRNLRLHAFYHAAELETEIGSGNYAKAAIAYGKLEADIKQLKRAKTPVPRMASRALSHGYKVLSKRR